mmetsp:Transcript_5636/g.21203  ORF Transcript_5636/g.21203 Transcript_5636/m.21203 type:complete len:580 (-) Transcript_5636:1148-2887(-)
MTHQDSLLSTTLSFPFHFIQSHPVLSFLTVLLAIPIAFWIYLYITHEYLFSLDSRREKYGSSRHFFAAGALEKVIEAENGTCGAVSISNSYANLIHTKPVKREPLGDASRDGSGPRGTLKHNARTSPRQGSTIRNVHQCIIIGAGPVGMTLASSLARNNIQFLLLEKKQISRHEASKAIGVHPDALEHFAVLDEQIVHEWVSQAIRVQIGRIFAHDRKLLGKARLDLARKPFPFSLALEQTKTESVLENGLLRIMEQERKVTKEAESQCASQYLKQREVTEVVPISQLLTAGRDHRHSAHILTQNGFTSPQDALNKDFRYIVKYTCLQTKTQHSAIARFVIGCEGKRSIVRKLANIDYHGAPLADTFIVGDFIDNTKLKDDAAIFLSREGLVEAFPLPGNRRRFICSTDKYNDKPTAEDVATLVLNRTNYDLSTQECTWISKFGIQSLVADRFFSNGLILAGDSAHICSPLGGQGMNCGFLDAFELGDALYKILHCGGDEYALLKRYEGRQQRRARAAIHRAEMNTALGRKPRTSLAYHVRNLIVRVALCEFFPMQWLVAMYFTMRFLGYLGVGTRAIV